jgi:hypothetical protein
MKRKTLISTAGFFLTAQLVILVVLLLGCEKKASDEIDFGTFNNSAYHNNFFGMSLTMPANWSIQDRSAQERLMKLGETMVAGDDKSMKTAMKASELQSVNLFAVYKYPLGSPVTNNPAVMAMAERVSQLPGIKRGKDYLFQVRQMLEASQVQVDVSNDTYTQQLGGVDFDVLDLKLHIRGMIIREKYYSTIMKGYALNFIFMFRDEQMDPAQQAVLDSVTFK